MNIQNLPKTSDPNVVRGQKLKFVILDEASDGYPIVRYLPTLPTLTNPRLVCGLVQY